MPITARSALHAAFAAIGLAIVVAVPASAHHPSPAGTAGLARVNPAVGPPLYTHGYDARPPHARLPSAFGEGGPERPPVCAGEHYQQVLYGRPEGAPDQLALMRPRIQAAVRRMNAVLNAESLASGGLSADYRVRCDAGGEIAVDGFTAMGASFPQIISGARAAGFDSTDADYLVFFDSRYWGSCGIASYIGDERLAADNRNNVGGGYGVVYSGCWFGETPMHESAHLMGAVQYGAPHSTGSGGHCFDQLDVMCYSPDGGSLNQLGTTSSCPDGVHFDCGFDDYFDSAPEPGEYLAANWNLGSPLNRYFAFSSPAAPPPGATPAATWKKLALKVPSRTKRLAVTLRADVATGLYLRRRRAPTEQRFGCRAQAKVGAAACRIRRPRRGRWFAAALVPAGSPAGTIRIRSRALRERGAQGPSLKERSRTWKAGDASG